MTKRNLIKKSPLAPTVLISGGAGLIGYYLTEAFLEKGARVVVTDNTSNLETNRVAKFMKDSKFALFDVGTTGILPAEIESVDYIIHVGDLEKYFIDKNALNLDTLIVNSQSIRYLLDLAVKSNAKFLLLSTIDVFEDINPVKASSNYFGFTAIDTSTFKVTEARKFAEALVWEHSRKFNTNVRVVRLPYVYGPKMSLDSAGALGSMLRDLIHRKDITIYGNENRKEYYLYIEDAVSGIIKALFNPKTSGSTYSLVGDEPQKVLTMAFLLRNLADRRTEVEFKDSLVDYTSDVRVPDIHNLNELEWWPKYTLKDGILKTLDHFGYRINVNAFKPNELILNKEKEKSVRVSPLNPIEESDSIKDILKKVDLDEQKEETFDFKKSSFTNQKALLPQEILSKVATYFSKFEFTRKLFEKSPVTLLGFVAVLLSALIIFIVSPVISFNSGLAQTYDSLQKTQESLYQLDIKAAQENSSDASNKLNKAMISFSKSRWFYGFLLGSEKYTSINNALISLKHFIKASSDLTYAMDPYRNIWSVLHLDSKDALNEEEIEKAKSYVISANNEIQLAKANFAYVEKDKLPNKVLSITSKYESYLNKMSDELSTVSNSLSDVNTLLGMDGPKTYILWFQNSNEIRPTGGFIGSYGLLTIDKGKIIGLNIDDIYNPDGQIKLKNINVSAPKPIYDALKEDRLFLRNSNWSPDLSMSAKEFSDLYTRATGVKTDGVIAIDLYFVKNILEAIGPVYLASYDEEINAQNLYERAQYHSDFNYSEGVSNKKAFLTVLGGKILETLFSLESNKLQPILGAVYKSLEEKHLALTFSNNSVNLFLEKKNWAGNLIGTDGDYLYIVNANLGGTKSNYYVKNDYNYTVSAKTRDGLLRGTLVLNYNHSGKDMSWPSGPYKDYVRVVVQNGSKLTGAAIKHADGASEDIFSNVVISKIGVYEMFEYFFTVNPQEKVTITFSYDLPQNLSLTDSFREYNLVWQKQPGTQDDKITLSIEPPFGMSTSSVETNISERDKTNTNKFNDVLNLDKKFFAKFK